MDVEKLIERLRTESLYKDKATLEIMDLCMDAAAAITELSGKVEQLESENQTLKKLAENGKSAIDTSQRLSQKVVELVSKTDKLEKQLAEVTAERDAAVNKLPHVCETCVYYKVFFNGCTPDHDCTNPDGGCSNNYDRWAWNRKGE